MMKEIPGENLKVLLAIRSMTHGGGAESLVFNIYKELKKRKGVQVKLVSFQKPEAYNSTTTSFFEEQLLGDPDFITCNSRVVLSMFGRNRSEVSEFTQIVNDFKPHVIHSNLFIAELIAHEPFFPAVKYFTHTHDNMKQLKNFSIETLFKKELLTNFYEKKYLEVHYKRCNNHFITISGDTKEYFTRVMPRKLRSNIYYLENAVNIKKFPPPAEPRNLDKIRIVNVGGFLEVKNQKFLVDVAEEMVKRKLNFHIQMLGDGPLWKQVKEKVEKKGLSAYIDMPRNVVHVEDYYHSANLYVHTSLSEAFGLVFVEAMATGLPIVSLDGRGNRGLIENDVNGYMMQEQNPAQFADAIEKIMKNKDLYERMRVNAMKIAEKYDIVPYVDRLIELYDKAS